jgi:hypothetical protein
VRSVSFAVGLPFREVLVHFSFGGEPVIELLPGDESAALRAPVGRFRDARFTTFRE